MKRFLGEDFLLSNGTAVRIYESFAKALPILDWHCHLDPREIWEDKPFENLTRLWLGGDHYKWRAMRSMGVPEALITGDGGDYEKFLAWARILSYLAGNPLYHWSHLELRRFFGVAEPLDEHTAPAVWERVNALLQTPGFTPRGLIERSNVEVICTTDDPADSLEYHEKLRREGKLHARVLPAMRPDKALQAGAPGFSRYLARIEKAAGMEIASFAALKEALARRIAYFDTMGCRASDHGFLYLPYAPTGEKEAEAIFAKALSGGELTAKERDAYQTALLFFLAEQYHRRGWVMEMHIGAIRDNNRRMFRRLGPDTGYDAVNDAPCAAALAGLLGSLDERGVLPKTVLFNLNPKDSFVLSTMMGCFQGGGVSKIQFGSAWWFLDHKDGMEAQLRTLAATGALAKFVGMVTDSRSFLSYPRHEYFRRILCNLLGSWVENGEYPDDPEKLREIIDGICCGNARDYFGL